MLRRVPSGATRPTSPRESGLTSHGYHQAAATRRDIRKRQEPVSITEYQFPGLAPDRYVCA
jgi:hypothetical protein